ncbi:PAS domain S-box protein [Shewanella sp. MEBiC00475]|uniref:PAS domain S-box protein n=1 Tax=Shewanella sp. MEBiC00475 TaxID=2575361 RepID=UPI0010C08852|nr:PAS domain S-box protein [Shewanella sp. MEBiC00475]
MTKLSSYKNALKWGLGVLTLGLVVSFAIAVSVKNQNNIIINQSLESVTEQVTNNIIDRIVLYQYGLRGARGAVATIGEDKITREIFKKYSSTRDIGSEFPGARGFGYIRRVPVADEARFVEKQKLNDWPNFTIKQLNAHDGERYLVQYVEYVDPIESNYLAVGLDIASEDNRRIAAKNSYLSGEVRLTGPITLIQATGLPLQSFLILMPIYYTGFTPVTLEEREKQAFGWSYAPLAANEVFANIDLSRNSAKLTLVDITDDKNTVIFYQTHEDEDNILTAYNTSLERDIFGRKWRVSLSAYPNFISELHLTNPTVVFLYGSVLSLLLAGVVGLYAFNQRRKRILLADTARRANILEHSLDAIISYDCDGIITGWNQGAENLFDYKEQEVLGSKSTDFIIPEDDSEREILHFAQVLKGKPILNYVCQHKRKDNELLSTSMTSMAIYNELGVITGVSQTIRDITLQQKAEKQILNHNARLERKVTERTHALQQALLENKTLLDNINQQLLYSETDSDGVILAVNDYFCIASGFTREQMIGQKHSILKSNEHDDIFWANMWQTITSGKTWQGEICNIDKQGNVKWFDTVIAPVMNDNGDLERCIALRIDITERKNTQLENNELAALLTNVLAAASEVAIISTGNDGIINIFNRGAELLLGYQAEEVVGIKSPAIWHLPAEVRQRSKELSEEFGEDIGVADVFVYGPKNVGPETRTWTYVRKDCSQCQVSLSLSAMRDHNGDIIGFLGVALNIDQMLKQQEELVSASNQLIKAAEVAELGIYDLDLVADNLQWNDRMFAMYDYPLTLGETGLSYQHWQQRIHPDDIAMAERALQQAVDSLKTTYETTFRIITRSNQIRYIHTGAQIYYDKADKPVRIVGVNRDITEQHELEQTLRFAKQAADAASAAKSAFLANMSHEIRTPMNAVLGMLQLIQHSDMSLQQADYVTKAESAAKSLLGLLNDILDFSKIDAGKLELDLHPFQLETLMRELAVMLATNGHSKNVEVIFDLDPAIPYLIEGDELRLRQVLLNLAGNAIKFTAEGHVIVSVVCNELTANQVSLTMSITDTGIGISQEQGDKIFQGFVQAESSTSRRFGGTGLGLAITTRLVELMGGELTLTSQVGEGSRFEFNLIFKIIEVTNNDCNIDLQGKNILIVDDSEMSRKILSKTLTTHGALVSEAHNSKQAIDLIEQSLQASNHYDVIVMDWRMPDKNGLETANHIQTMFPVGKAPAIIMLTAYGAEVMEQTKQYLQPPFVNMLTKPVTANLMLEAVFQAINGAAQPLPAKKITHLALKGVRVLVVEDNQLNRQVIDELLRLQGAIVTLAKDGIEGVDWVTKSNNQFDIVIMDMQMPVMDGLEATRLIRADGRFNELSILAMTANASLADKTLCLEAGMDDHIAKPIDMTSLLPCMLNLLGLEDNTYSVPAVNNVPIALADVYNDDDIIIENSDSILRRFGGERAFIIDVIHHFATEMHEQLSLLTQAFEQQDDNAISLVAHTIKGTASNIGAKRLAAFAATLEQNMKHAVDVEPAAYLSQMQGQINDSLHMLEMLFPDESVELTVNSLEKKILLPIKSVDLNKMDQLMALLVEQNLDAIEYLELLLSNVELDDQVLKLKKQVNQLEFLDAIDTLKSIIKE